MNGRYITEEIAYTGAELTSHWAYRNFDLLGDSIVGFQGACDVPTERMVDLADVKADAPIRSDRMLHLIVEHFGTDLERTVLRQRILLCIILELLNTKIRDAAVVRRGDDLFLDDAKLSVSIAAKTPVSCMIHVGLNVLTTGTPVRTVGLSDLGMDPEHLAETVIRCYIEEMEGVRRSQCKVRGIR
jgi:hypothetical protein